MTHSQKRSNEISLITKMDFCRMLSVSEASIDRWLRTDPDFPQPRRLGPNSIRWIRQEVNVFITRLTPVAYDDHAFDPADV